MPRVVSFLALALIAVGAIYPLTTGTTSVTAWIPAMLGAAVLLLVLWGRAPARALIVLLALAGLGASIWRLVKGGFDLSAGSQQAQALTTLLCLGLLAAVLRRANGRGR